MPKSPKIRLRDRASSQPVIRLMIGFQLFFGLLLWTPIFFEYQRQLGISVADILAIQSIYYVAFCLLEIPTGMIADRIGYRRCMLAGGAVLVVSNVMPVSVPSYWGFLVHFLLIALARSLVSGASSAYLYEFMAANGEREQYKQAEGSARSYSLVGKVVGWPLVGLAMQWEMTLPYWLTAVSAVLAVVMAYRLPPLPDSVRKPTEDPLAGSSISRAPVITSVRESLGLLRRTPMLLLFMAQGVAVFTLGRICQVNLFQPILTADSVPLVAHGMVMSAMSVFEALGSARPGIIRRFLTDSRAVFVLTVVMAGTLALTVPGNGVATIAALCVFALAMGLSFPIQRQLINDAIPPTPYRATLLSIESIIDRGVCALVALALGSYLAEGALAEFLLLSAGASVALMAVLLAVLPLVRRRVTRGGEAAQEVLSAP
ncbi:MFS transporter [Allokutzneria sp. NRRL B-24872]|uniref:MFS transporter n=1 Tax=Allokutzneria sp. NRRL B-24872 TaxID=1137961 RepID=UPI000A39B900|nr:MFS transporter [Allokutzneria sp. NRRL B-24872]